MVVPERTKTQNKVDNTVIEAEKFRATVAQPGELFNQGNLEQIMYANGLDGSQFHNAGINGQGKLIEEHGQVEIPDIGAGVSDDHFFHLTCHIEPSLIHKIEKGELVELEKILPKDKINKGDDNRLEWIHKDGGTFLVPAQ